MKLRAICDELYHAIIYHCPTHEITNYVYNMETIMDVVLCNIYVIRQYLDKLPEYPKIWNVFKIYYDNIILNYCDGNYVVLYDIMNKLRKLIILLNTWLYTGNQDNIDLGGVYWDVEKCNIDKYEFEHHINCLMDIFIKHICKKIDYDCCCDFNSYKNSYSKIIKYINYNVNVRHVCHKEMYNELKLIKPYCTLETYTQKIIEKIYFINNNITTIECEAIPRVVKDEMLTIQLSQYSTYYVNVKYLYKYGDELTDNIPKIVTFKTFEKPTCEQFQFDNTCVICDCDYNHNFRSIKYTYDIDHRMCGTCIKTFPRFILNIYPSMTNNMIIFKRCIPLLRNYNKIIILLQYFNSNNILFRDIIFNIVSYVRLLNEP